MLPHHVVLSLLIGVVCVKGVGRVSITCRCIALGLWSVGDGVWFIWGAVGHVCIMLDLFTGWPVNIGQHRCYLAWRFVPHCVLSCLWQERNTRHFEDCERTTLVLKLLFFSSFVWVGGGAWHFFFSLPCGVDRSFYFLNHSLFLCILLVCLGFFSIILLLIKKKSS